MTTIRGPQSVQSVPKAHKDSVAPRPPSWHAPSLESVWWPLYVYEYVLSSHAARAEDRTRDVSSEAGGC